jgi:hypothetical protein
LGFAISEKMAAPAAVRLGPIAKRPEPVPTRRGGGGGGKIPDFPIGRKQKLFFAEAGKSRIFVKKNVFPAQGGTSWIFVNKNNRICSCPKQENLGFYNVMEKTFFLPEARKSWIFMVKKKSSPR